MAPLTEMTDPTHEDLLRENQALRSRNAKLEVLLAEASATIGKLSNKHAAASPASCENFTDRLEKLCLAVRASIESSEKGREKTKRSRRDVARYINQLNIDFREDDELEVEQPA